MSFEAKYPGYCPSCSDRIEVGDDVQHDADAGYVHTECDDQSPPERATVTCSECWLIQPCECDS